MFSEDELNQEEFMKECLDNVMTFAEASSKWGLGESTLRSVVKSDRLVCNKDYKKSGSTWLITKKAMEKLYDRVGEFKLKSAIEDVDIKYWRDKASPMEFVYDSDGFYIENFKDFNFSDKEIEEVYSDLEVLNNLAKTFLENNTEVQDLMFELYN